MADKHLLDQASLIFKNAKVGSKLTLSPTQQETLIKVIHKCDWMARDKLEFARTFREFWEKKAIQSPDGEIVSFLNKTGLIFVKQDGEKMKHRELIRMREAVRESENSHESTKVGAVLYFMKNKRVWFEPIRGWNQRNANGKIVHAEEYILDGHTGMMPTPHVIPFMPEEKAQLYITKAPCFECCQLIVMAKIEKVVCPKPYDIHPVTGEQSKWFESQMNGIHLLQKNKIEVQFMEITNG